MCLTIPQQNRKYYQNRLFGAKRIASEGWHADITFERIPSDYAILKIIKTPEDIGGDTLWASGYEAFDRLSPIWQRFAEGLTATHYQVCNDQLFQYAEYNVLRS
jgi:alpha-ketoglutarate-dependent taurine dioxygenase